MKFPRSAGILLHPTSLPGKFPLGDLGAEAYHFIDFLAASGQTLWQVLPLGPSGYGDSPYQCFSAFAGNPYLLSPERLRDDGLLTDADLANIPSFDPHCIEFGGAIDYKMKLLSLAYENAKRQKIASLPEFTKFCREKKAWLDDYAVFMSIKQHHDGANWAEWEKDLRTRKPAAIKAWEHSHADEIAFHKFLQFEFYNQWHAVRTYANGKNIRIVGDLPIFIAYDSADAWSKRKFFTIDNDGKPETVAGVPPDYFSPTGQLWGNPLYRWNEMAKDNFAWWRMRIAASLEQVDIIRIDHFRGFDQFWEIPGNAPTAQAGKWTKAPGKKFFATIKKALGDLPIIAEDLGFITPAVLALRDACGFPGMKILQFAFGKGMERKFLPHDHIPHSVVYTGSHDNDTTRAYFEKAAAQNNDIVPSARRYLNYTGDDLRFELIRTAYASVADTVIIPMQDVLNLGSDARMNFPGKLGGNWSSRFSWNQVSSDMPQKYKTMVEVYERSPKK